MSHVSPRKPSQTRASEYTCSPTGGGARTKTKTQSTNSKDDDDDGSNNNTGSSDLDVVLDSIVELEVEVMPEDDDCLCNGLDDGDDEDKEEKEQEDEQKDDEEDLECLREFGIPREQIKLLRILRAQLNNAEEDAEEDDIIRLVVDLSNKVHQITKKVNYHRDKLRRMEGIKQQQIIKLLRKEIREAFETFTVGWIKKFGDASNLGQKLDGKPLGVLLAFAVNQSIFLETEDSTGVPYDKMDLLNCCLMFLMRHTFYSILLQGGTDKEILTTELAEKLFLELVTFMDASPLCCQATVDDPEGNSWKTLLKQFKKIAPEIGISETKIVTFMFLVGNLCVAIRALDYHVSTGCEEPFKLLVCSIRTSKRGFKNKMCDIINSSILVVLNNPHPMSSMLGITTSDDFLQKFLQNKP